MRPRIILSALMAALALLLVACPSAGSPNGSLQLTIDGLPTGVDGAVTVTGAGGFSQRVTATATLANLKPGIYVLAAEAVLTDAPVVSEAYDVTTPPPAKVEVIANMTASATTTYARRPGSGRLWKPLLGDTLLFGFADAQLASSGTPTPDVTLIRTGGGNDQGVTFDGDGNAWVTNSDLRTLSRYDAVELESDATLTPDVTIRTDGASLVRPVGLAFDVSGNLWITDLGAGQLQMFTPTQLASSGTPTPTVVVGTDGTSLQAPCGLAFDAGGNLWARNLTVGGGRAEKFTPTQLATSGTPTPQVTLASDGTSLTFSCGLAFDASGNMWATGGDPSNRLEMFASGQLSTGGTPTPTVIIESDGTSLSNPFALAFDNGGNLWASATGNDTLEKFTPDQLASSGAPTPEVTIGGGNTDVGAFAFSPAPANLPINAP